MTTSAWVNVSAYFNFMHLWVILSTTHINNVWVYALMVSIALCIPTRQGCISAQSVSHPAWPVNHKVSACPVLHLCSTTICSFSVWQAALTITIVLNYCRNVWHVTHHARNAIMRLHASAAQLGCISIRITHVLVFVLIPFMKILHRTNV